MHICSGDIGSEKADRQLIPSEDDDFCPYEKNMILKMKLNLIHYFRSIIKEI